MATLDTGGVLSALTGRLLVQGGFSKLHETLETLAGYSVWTHQIGTVINDVAPRYLAANADLNRLVESIKVAFDSDGVGCGLAAAGEAIKSIGPTIEIDLIDCNDTENCPVESLFTMLDKGDK